MDDELIAFGGDEHDHLEEVGRSVGSDDQLPVRIFAEVIDDHRVLNCMKDVIVSDAVAAGRRVDLHAGIVYYETLDLDQRLWPPAGNRRSLGSPHGRTLGNANAR